MNQENKTSIKRFKLELKIKTKYIKLKLECDTKIKNRITKLKLELRN